MAEILHPTNFDPINITEIGELSADALASQKIFNVTSSQGLVSGDYLVLGSRGGETAEIGQIDTINGEAVTLLANLRFKHYRNEPVTKLMGNQIKIYRSANVDGTPPSDVGFSSIATLTIDADQLYTPYTDNSGGSGYWYKKTYYNPTSSFETDLADADAIRGGGAGHYVTVDEVRREAGLQNNRWIDDTQIFEKLISAESEVDASLVMGLYTLPLTDVPEQIKNATRLLAAGYLLTVDYGPEHNGTNKDGEKKIAMARAILKGYETGETTLVTSTGEVVGKGSQVKYYPTDSESETEPRKFSMQDKW